VIEVLSVLWTILTFFLGIAWSLAWFILRDVLSSLFWVTLVIWGGLVVRHRSFSLGSRAVLRYARYGVIFLWRWLRGKSTEGIIRPKQAEKPSTQRLPFGYISLSAELNVLLVGMFILLAHL
jgi:hypothetical protein